MGVADWVTSGAIKTSRAEQLFKDFESAVDRLAKEGRYAIREEPDHDPRKIKLVFAEVPPPAPLSLGALAGDIIHNLRSSLDTLWLLSAFNAAFVESDRHSPSFPIRKTWDELVDAIGRQKPCPAKAAVELVLYLIDQDLWLEDLWPLAEADNYHKHKLLSVVNHAIIELPVPPAGVPTFPKFGAAYVDGSKSKVIGPVKKDAVFATVDKGTDVNMYPQFVKEIAFVEPQVLARKPAASFLSDTIGVVSFVVKCFADAGLIKLH